MVDSAERKVLDMVEQGQISAEDGLRLINAMGSKAKSNSSQPVEGENPSNLTAVELNDQEGSAGHSIPKDEMQRMTRLKRWWMLPFGLGLLITTLGAIWMYMGYTDHGFGFGFWLAWLPFLLGIFIIAVSFQTNKSVWLHVRIKQEAGEKPERLAISIPLPVIMTRWFMSNFGDRIPGIKDQPIGDVSEILENVTPENPFYVHINEEDGEEVEVFIG